jgi:hypothetical protein
MLSLVPILGLSGGTLAAVNDHYPFVVDTVHSRLMYEIDSNLGLCDLGAGAHGEVTGTMVLALHPGVFPISSGQFDGGDCACTPDLVGIVPGSLPGLPPLLEVRLSNLVVQQHSPTFQCDSNGAYLADVGLDVTGGNLDVSVSGGPFLPVPIVGATSDHQRTQGQLWIDDSGIHVIREVGNTITLNVPALNLDLYIGIRGVIRGQMAFPTPTSFCPATPNSTGQPAQIGFAGTPSVSRNDGQLLVMSCPPATMGVFITSDEKGQVPFGNGTLCATGRLLRLATVQVSATGSATAALDLQAPPAAGNLVAGTHWIFQCAYRDVAAGGALFNASDAVAIDFVP